MQYKFFALSALAASASAIQQSSSTTATTGGSNSHTGVATPVPQNTGSSSIGSASASGLSSSAASLNPISVLQILQTAVPKSLYSEYKASPSAVIKSVESEFLAGSAPAWYTGLPTAVQTYLVGGLLSANSTALASAISNATATGKGNSTAHMTKTTGRATLNPHHTGGAGGRTTQVTGMASSSMGSGSGSGSSGSSSSSSGGASLPTAMVGAGLAGAVGIVGLFAL